MTSLAHSTKNDTRAADLAKQVSMLGALSAKSAHAKPALAIAVTRAAFDGVITEDDIEEIHGRYLKARAAEISKNVLSSGEKEDNANSVKANKSKLMQLCKLGMLPGIDGPALLDKVTDQRTVLQSGDAKVKPAFDCFVDVSRAQIRNPKEALTDDQVDTLICRPEKQEKEMVEKLCGLYKSTYNIAAKMGDEGIGSEVIATVQEAYEKIADAIKGMDGDVPAMTKEAKEEAKALSFMRKQGFTLIKMGDVNHPDTITSPNASLDGQAEQASA